MSINIVFGNKTLGKKAVELVSKYPDLAVVTIEGYKGKGKTRRTLFNATAMSGLGLEAGVSEELILGEGVDESGANIAFIANVEALGGVDEALQTYKVNGGLAKVNGEKFKTVSISGMAKNLINYLELADDENTTEDLELVLVESESNPGVFQLEPHYQASLNDSTECTNNCATPCAAHAVQQEEEIRDWSDELEDQAEEEFVAEAQLSGLDELTKEVSSSDDLLEDAIEDSSLRSRRIFS